LEQNFHDQAKALIDGGVDLLMVETSQDTRNVKAALLAYGRLMKDGAAYSRDCFRHH